MTHLSTRIDEFVAGHVLTRRQGVALLDDARRDFDQAYGPAGVASAGRPSPGPPSPGRPSPGPPSPGAGRNGAVLEVLGYVGASLLLGAAGFTAFMFWDEMSSVAQKLIGIAAVLVPGVAGGLLVGTRWRPHVGQLLLAAALCAIPFPWTVLFDWSVLGPFSVMLAGGVAGVVLLRHWAFLAPLVMGGYAITVDLAIGYESFSPWRMAIGLGLVALLCAGSGLLVNRSLSWSVAGLGGWSAASTLIDTPLGPWGTLVGSTVVAALLFLAFVRRDTHATAVVGSLIVLTMWPACLSRIFGASVGVALGLVAAGTVLITAVVVLSRRSHRRSVAPTTS